MAMSQAEKELMRKRLSKEYAAESKKRGPTVGGSLKEGVKAVGRSVKGAAKKAVGRVASASPYSGKGDAARKRRIERETK